jgi:phosphoserine phosphatase RsbU/P
MFRQRLTTGFAIGAGVVVLILLIGLITYVAITVISQTIQEQFRTAELQLVTSLSQQTQASLNNLGAGISELAIREEIRATSPTRQQEAVEILAEEAEGFSPGTLISITRFDFRGAPRYAWPPELNDTLRTLESPQDYAYAIPQRLLELTNRGQRATSEIPVELHRVPRYGQGQTVLLISPIDSVSLNTEFIAFELDLSAMFAGQFDFVELGESGQLWVVDSRSDLSYQAQPEPDIEPVFLEFSLGQLRGTVEPRIDSYEDQEEDRQIAIARTQALSETFVILLSRNQNEAEQAIRENGLFIFLFAVTAIIGVVIVGSLIIRQFTRVSDLRRLETQRRETARTLLEVSRALNSSLDLSVVLAQILEQLGRLVPHNSASILLLEGNQELRVAATHGLRSSEAGGLLNLDQARAARVVIASGYPIVINDTTQDNRWSPDANNVIMSWVGLPLRVRDQLVGVLNINSRELEHFKPQDIEVAEAFADQASVALQNARSHEIEVKQFEQELIIARGIQASLLPDAPPEMPQVEFVARSLPASQVSGDYFQYLPIPDGKIGIAIGDVQGKGIPAALLMAVITTALRDEIARNPQPAALLQALNTRLLSRMQRTHMNSALIVATFDPATHQLEVANGGMVQPYIRHKDSQIFDFVPVGGYPLGVSDNMKYASKTVMFEPGSLMVLFSDGVVEAQNSDGEFLGFDRVEALLNGLPEDVSAQTVMEQLYAAVQGHLGGLSPQDDTTIMVMRALEHPVDMPDLIEKPQNGHNDGEKIGDPAALIAVPLSADVTTVISQSQDVVIEEMRAPALVSTIEGPQSHKMIELYLPSKLGFEKIARGTVEALAIELGFPEERIEDLKTAVAEACMNAIEHGNGQDLNEAVNVSMMGSRAQIEVRVTDRGRKQLATEFPAPGKGDMRGWGLFFIQKLMDVVEIKHLPDGGNQVLMVRYANQKLDSEPQIGHNDDRA